MKPLSAFTYARGVELGKSWKDKVSERQDE